MGGGGAIECDHRAQYELRYRQKHQLPPQAQGGNGACACDESPDQCGGNTGGGPGYRVAIDIDEIGQGQEHHDRHQRQTDEVPGPLPMRMMDSVGSSPRVIQMTEWVESAHDPVVVDAVAPSVAPEIDPAAVTGMLPGVLPGAVRGAAKKPAGVREGWLLSVMRAPP